MKALIDALGGVQGGAFQCPMGPGHMVLSNVTMNGILPFPANTKLCLAIKFIGRKKNAKNFVNVLKIHTNVTYVMPH